MSAYAQSTDAKWPFFTMPLYESYAEDILKQSKLEVIALAPYVAQDEQAGWVEYANATYAEWVEEGHMIRSGNLDRLKPVAYHPFISRPSPEGFVPDISTREYYFPFWSFSPAPAAYGAINWNMVAVPDYAPLIEDMLYLRNETVVSRVRPSVAAQGLAFTPEEHQALHSELPDSLAEYPHSFFWFPIHENIKNPDSKIVALTAAMGSWDVALRNLLPTGVEGIFAILRNSCNQTYTYEIRGPDAFYRGEGDLHDSQYDDNKISIDLNPNTHPEYRTTNGHCRYIMVSPLSIDAMSLLAYFRRLRMYSISRFAIQDIYPSKTFEEAYDSNTPELFAIVVASTFVLVAVLFLVYDIAVERRNRKIIENAARSSAIVTSMFPSHVRDQIMEAKEKSNTANKGGFGAKSKMKNFLSREVHGGDSDGLSEDKPIAGE